MTYKQCGTLYHIVVEKNQGKKTHTMGLRLDDDTYTELSNLSQEMQIKKSALLKKALRDWTKIRMSVNFENMVIIGKPMLKFLLENIEEEQAVEMASIISNNICSVLTNRIFNGGQDISIKNFLEFFVSGMGSNGKGWFDQIKLQEVTENKYHLFGNHQFGGKFSIFIFNLVKNILKSMKNLEYDITEDLKINNNDLISIYVSKKA